MRVYVGTRTYRRLANRVTEAIGESRRQRPINWGRGGAELPDWDAEGARRVSRAVALAKREEREREQKAGGYCCFVTPEESWPVSYL